MAASEDDASFAAQPRDGLLDGIVAGQRGHLFPWVPVALACGIAVWFGLRFEPGPLDYVIAALCGGLTFWLAFHQGGAGRVLLFAASLLATGFVLAGVRAHTVDAPVLGFRYYGPVEGRVIEIDRSASGKLRLTLDRVRLDDVRDVPARVRVSLHWDGPQAVPRPGLTVATTAHLGPPGGPVEPGGFDFRRMAWFEKLGAVGYAQSPLVVMAAVDGARITALRYRIAEGLRARLPGDSGAVAAAILVGDRSGLSDEVAEMLRTANLAHLLAISGLHMGLVTGTVFGVARFLMALSPWLALRVDARRLAALSGLAAGGAYLVLSGGSVPTERAFVMATVVLVAIFLRRRALTLRAVAVAATLILVIRPEALSGPGFILSFAATTALVAAFEHSGRGTPGNRVRQWAMGLLISSVVAGAATAPFAAAFFNAYPRWGLVANLLAVPVMGFLVMPAALVAAVSYPFGLEGAPLAVLGAGIDAILTVARWIASWPDASIAIKAPPDTVLPLLALGGCVLCVWRGRGRLAGVLPIALAAVLWLNHPRPEVLVSETGGLVGILGPDGRALTRPRGDGFAAQLWLENDGDPTLQEVAAARTAFELPVGILHLKGKKAFATWDGTCRTPTIVLTDQSVDGTPDGCVVFDADRLQRTGSLAITFRGSSFDALTANEVTGERRWTGAPVPALSAFAPAMPKQTRQN